MIMKIQATIYNILLTRLLPIILLGIFEILLVFMLISEPSARQEPSILLMILGVGVVLIGLLWSMFDTLIRRKLGAIILTEEGFYCPYLLDKDQLIPWENVLFIKMEVLNARGIDVPFLVIGLGSTKLKRRRYMMDNYHGRFTKKYFQELLVFSGRIMSDYELPEICDLMRLYYKKYIGESFRINTRPTEEHKKMLLAPLTKERERTFVYYCAVFNLRDYALTLCFCMLIGGVISWILFSARPVFSIVFGIVMGFFIMALFAQSQRIQAYSADRLMLLAIDMDKNWIYQVNKYRFASPLRWNNLIKLEINRKRKGRYSEPYLLVQVKDYDGKIITNKIRNDLRDTSVYELYEVMQKHYENKT